VTGYGGAPSVLVPALRRRAGDKKHRQRDAPLQWVAMLDARQFAAKISAAWAGGYDLLPSNGSFALFRPNLTGPI
jgi:hypothetical protein